VSTASRVKETWSLTGDDARRTLRSTGRLALLKDAAVRLRAADGTSHARSLAFAVSLVLVQGLVVVVGFAVAFGSSGLGAVIVDTVSASAPAQAGDLTLLPSIVLPATTRRAPTPPPPRRPRARGGPCAPRAAGAPRAGRG